MVPSVNSSSETAVPVGLGRRKRCDDLGSSVGRMDRPEGMEFDDDLDNGHIHSSDLIMNLLKADDQPFASRPSVKEPSCEPKGEIVNLTTKLERISPAGNFNAPLNEKFRISSGDFIQHFDDEAESWAMQPPLFMSNADHDHPANRLPPLPPPAGSPACTGRYQMPPMPPLPNPMATAPAKLPSAYPATTTAEPNTCCRREKSRRRMVDESRAVEPTPDDVLFGRGGSTNRHPGNVRFRRKALELRSWYEQSSKDQKRRIADILVEMVTGEGNRFLERGGDGLWHEVIGNGSHTKASQALRERIKGGRKRSRAGLA